MPTAEHQRLRELTDDNTSWRRWGPYVSDRAWGTVREDYSAGGDAWDYLPHDYARSKAYRWGEDAIAGWCDRYQLLVCAPAFWNDVDPILKERLFGLTGPEGNHGEDVKEYYFHADGTPTHSYMQFVFKYAQTPYPYGLLIEENRRRGGSGFEFELLDTGVFDQDRYFDIVIEYAKATTEDICIRITAHNRGPDTAPLHILPHLWFRNTWSWGARPGPLPLIQPGPRGARFVSLLSDDSALETLTNIPVHYRLGQRVLYGSPGGELLFTNNETNTWRLYDVASPTPFVKDAFHRYLVDGAREAMNPAQGGTKAALHYHFPTVAASGSVTVRLRLSDDLKLSTPLDDVDRIIATRQREADEFYGALQPPAASADEKLVQRQAFAGLLWTKQSYLYDVDQWLTGDRPDLPPPEQRRCGRNQHWRHLNSLRVMTVPDKWEYPWFAAWDLAFHCVALALVDPDYAKSQLWVLLFEQFQHPNGQIPAYEWEFSDLNPPVHAWAVWRVFSMEREREKQRTGNPHARGDRDFLERCFHKLLINFAWWINKVDRAGNNIFEGGFLGLDNITVWDRSEPFTDGSVLEQADATGWMGMFCLNLMRIALELARENAVYQGLATKFFQHYTYVAGAMKHMGNRDYALWDERDGFFYDVIRRPNGKFDKLRVRSLVGLIPLFAVERLEMEWLKPFPEFKGSLDWFLRNRQDLVRDVVHTCTHDGKETKVLTIVNDEQLVRILQRVWDETEFLSDYGIRSLSKRHEDQPFVLDGRVVAYEPAEAGNRSKIKGGNSNWRGPIWFPTCFLLIESLRKLGKAYGPTFQVPLKDGRTMTFPELARDLANRMIGIFTRNEQGRRPVFGGAAKFQDDPHWRDLVLFYEYFHGDNGAGLGASHQTGWTALVASLIDEWRH